MSQLSHATTNSTNRKPAVLLVVDLQRGIVDDTPDNPRSTPALTTNVTTLLRTWRQAQWPIIHVVHHDPDPSHPLNKDTNPAGHAAHPCSAPVAPEPVLVKTAGSAFTDPALRLEERLAALGGGPGARVVVIGMDGAQCINDNARGAFDRGFRVVVVADACATYGMPHFADPARSYGAADAHDAAMSMLANGFARVVTTEQLLGEVAVEEGSTGA